YLFSGALIIASLVSVSIWGLNFGIDFTGGSLLEARFSETVPALSDVTATITKAGLGDAVVQMTGDRTVLIRIRPITEQQHAELAEALRTAHGAFDELRFDSIGPSIGEELRQKAVYAILFVLIATILYIAWSFRHVSYPVSSWVYGVITVITAFHDVIIPVGLFSILGKWYGVETNSAFVAAVLTIMGYSINDTIVVLDRIRENVKSARTDFATTVGTSLRQTIARSVNTTLTTLLALVAVYFFGGESVRYFALALAVGIATGAYSSIFIASPLLVSWQAWRSRRL
ncbi:protein translocase subunit SecF, partial [Candidatus Uhrbacteria bacterium]|nr:protein translocase subunit SecF [Candidatus Uhrbacteria bacterium]